MSGEPFTDSRRLTGPNPYFAGTGAALEAGPEAAVGDATLAAWRATVEQVRAHLVWPTGPLLARRHCRGASLVLAAPADQLYTATELNEWAWLLALASAGEAVEAPLAPGHPALHDRDAALATLVRMAAAEAQPALVPLLARAQSARLPVLLDEDALTLGSGRTGRTWPLAALPATDEVPWPALAVVPTALVTGSNGKTTTVRLLAAMARAHGWRTAHSCTDGLYLDADLLDGGDWSGPAGARTLLRRPEVEAAVLETARGGLLRRGMALARADVALVTNISADHFGEYGIHDLDDLAWVKLTVARAIEADGVLVLNADDPVLVRHAAALACPLAWFGLDASAPALVAARQEGLHCCAPEAGHLWLHEDGVSHDLGAAASMPLTASGSARYNLANAAAAALAARALGIAPATIADVLARFGASARDNPGRLQRWQLDGLAVLLDYAHNPEGLTGLLEVAGRQPGGRLALLLGQAGNREDAQIRDLATAAARFAPDRVVLKDMEGYLRGRGAGEVAGILARALHDGGVPPEALVECLDEVEAVRGLLAWARTGDTLVLPVHNADARDQVCALLDALVAVDWRPGQALPVVLPPS
ncbi:MAG: Mur ligase [Xanthomonadales bacterium]|nr:Mur ligase [Xanthomonadales bacterium]